MRIQVYVGNSTYPTTAGVYTCAFRVCFVCDMRTFCEVICDILDDLKKKTFAF